jgi:arginine N-succinyltransferase
MNVFVIRPIAQSDLDGLMELLKDSGFGLTTLPSDPEVLMRRIKHSERSFEHREKDRPSGENYLFVMEEIFTGKIVGVSGIISKIGGFEPYYFYRIESKTYESKMLHVKRDVKSLHLEVIHNGPAEICSLFLSPDYRNAQNGRFLSLSRFMFMADNRQYFEQDVIAEMRGQVDDTGNSPFWEAVGKHFFQIDFPTADYLTMKSKKFIEELMPEHPILVDILPEAAQKVVGQVHEQTAPAKRILEQEGFSFSGLVGIFEPGPVVIGKLDNIRTIKKSKVAEIAKIDSEGIEEEVFIISKHTPEFRACLGPVKALKGDQVQISPVTAAALKMRLGDKIRYVTLKDHKDAFAGEKKPARKKKTT